VLTGRVADIIIIIDDPLKPEEALSQAHRQGANEWFDHTLYSRLNDKQQGAIVLIMHRLHESLPSGVTRGRIWSGTCWRRRTGGSFAFRRSPVMTRRSSSTASWGRVASSAGAARHCIPRASRSMRMHAQTAVIENGFVHLPDTAPWLAQYLLTSFPKGRHDDQVDSTAQLLDWFKRGSGPSSNAGIFELYRMQAEEARGQQARRERRVRLRVPSGIGHRNMLLLNVAADGTVEMLESEAESFLRAGWEAGGLAGTGSSDLTW
jgi:predicted phage terminase large subunit-like protein